MRDRGREGGVGERGGERRRWHEMYGVVSILTLDVWDARDSSPHLSVEDLVVRYWLSSLGDFV